jgi:hypothetical protein
MNIFPEREEADVGQSCGEKIMKIGKWRISAENLWFKKELTWLYLWQCRFILFAFFITDLSGRVIIGNFLIKWEKMFR